MPATEIGVALRNQSQGQIRTNAVNLRQIGARQLVERRPDVEIERVKSRTYIDTRSMLVYNGRPDRPVFSDIGRPPSDRDAGWGLGSNHFPKRGRLKRHQHRVRSFPWARFFDGVAPPKS